MYEYIKFSGYNITTVNTMEEMCEDQIYNFITYLNKTLKLALGISAGKYKLKCA